MLRSCYFSDMVLTVGQPAVPGGWYWATTPRHTRHTYGSLIWWKDNASAVFPGIGEVARHGWRDGSVLPCVQLGCSACTMTTPGHMTFTLSGCADHGVWNTSLLNNTWACPKQGGGPNPCAWSLNPTPGVSQTEQVSVTASIPPGFAGFRLQIGVQRKVGTVVQFSSSYRYDLATPPVSCLSPLTFTGPVLVPSVNDSAPWAHPASVTVTPGP